MGSLALAIALTVVFAGPALASPGDPRLIQGTLEWPPALSGGELFVVLRSDDGHTYYADVMSAQRLTDSAVSTGSRIAILGLEGTKPHEIIAVALGSGDAAALSYALAQGTPNPAPAVARSTPPSPAPAAAVPQPPSGTTAAAPSTPSVVRSTPAPVPAAAAPQPPAPAPATAPTVRPEDLRPPRVAGPRWMTLQGKVYGVAAQTLFLRKDDGQIVVIDISKLEPGTDLRLKPGSPVEVIVAPVGKKFQATGFVEPETTTPRSTAAKPGR